MTAEDTSNEADQRKTDEEYASVIRALVRHENDVSNHRTTWLLAIQGAILAAIVSTYKERATGIVLLGAIIGISIAISIQHSLKNSEKSRRHLKGLWKKRADAHRYTEDDIPPIDGGFTDLSPIRWLQPWNFIPRLLIAIWLLILLVTCLPFLCKIIA